MSPEQIAQMLDRQIALTRELDIDDPPKVSVVVTDAADLR